VAKAEKLSTLVNDKAFMCTTGWIDRFKLRHDISCVKVSREARAVNCETTAECLNFGLPKVREQYSDSNTFNAD
jgi:hypothetical protein